MLKNGYDEYETEHGKGVAIHDLKGLHAAIGMHLITHKAVLSGAEVRFLRKELEMSQNELAYYLGVCESSVRNYEKDRNKKPPTAAERLLRALYVDKIKGRSKVGKLLATIAKLNRDQYHESLELEETPEGWKQAA